MTSERRRQANQNNAKRSTGPRTAQGKLRTKLNAQRHGLATKQAALPEVERMATAICGKGASRLHYEEALNVAESQFMLQAVRDARLATIKRMMSAAPASKEQVAESGEPVLEDEGQAGSEEQSSQENEEHENIVAAVVRALPELARYDRYERRALSRRRRAIRNFVAVSVLGTRPARRRR
jgi:hypothetical protein